MYVCMYARMYVCMYVYTMLTGLRLDRAGTRYGIGVNCELVERYRGADKSLARPGREQATATEDFEFHVSYL